MSFVKPTPIANRSKELAEELARVKTGYIARRSHEYLINDLIDNSKAATMPKIVDHEQRRHEVAEATWRVILRDGLEHTSFTAIAAELGSTTGVLAHYFRNKDALMLFALDRAMGDPNQISLEITLPVGLDRLQRLLEVMLPIKVRRQTAWRVWVAFLGHALSRPALLKVQRQRYAMFRQILRAELVALSQAHLIRSGLDLDVVVAGMIALVDGIGVGYVLEAKQFPVGRQRQLVAQYINSLR
jgi:AcrR family transcriptional regulator